MIDLTTSFGITECPIELSQRQIGQALGKPVSAQISRPRHGSRLFGLIENSLLLQDGNSYKILSFSKRVVQ